MTTPRPTPVADPTPAPDVGALATGFMSSQILFAAVELGVFDALSSGPLAAAELAQRVGGSARSVERLGVALVALRLLRRHGDGRFENGPTAAALTRAEDPGMVAFLRHANRHFYRVFGALADAVRDDCTQLEHWSLGGPGVDDAYAALSAQPEEYALMLDAMDFASRGVGTAIARLGLVSDDAHLLDLGHGGGQVARELLDALPRLTLTAIDLPAALQHSRSRAVAAGAEARMRWLAADLREPLPFPAGAADAVLLSAVLGDFPPSGRAALLGAARASLRPGGLLLISETLLDDDGTGPLLPAMLSLSMALLTGGDNFTPTQLRTMVQDADFTHVVIHRQAQHGLRDLLVARRPEG